MLFRVLETVTAAYIATQKGSSAKSEHPMIIDWGEPFIPESSGKSTPSKISSQTEQNCKDMDIIITAKQEKPDRR